MPNIMHSAHARSTIIRPPARSTPRTGWHHRMKLVALSVAWLIDWLIADWLGMHPLKILLAWGNCIWAELIVYLRMNWAMDQQICLTNGSLQLIAWCSWLTGTDHAYWLHILAAWLHDSSSRLAEDYIHEYPFRMSFSGRMQGCKVFMRPLTILAVALISAPVSP